MLACQNWLKKLEKKNWETCGPGDCEKTESMFIVKWKGLVSMDQVKDIDWQRKESQQSESLSGDDKRGKIRPRGRVQ